MKDHMDYNYFNLIIILKFIYPIFIMSSDNFIKIGKMNLISEKDKKEINYVIIPKGYFRIESQNYENKVDKILKALNLEKPEMIFRVPRN